MNTDALIADLANDAPPVRPRAVERRLIGGLALGGIVTFALIAGWLGVRPDFAAALHGRTIWMKWAYTAVLALIALATTRRLARPDSRRVGTLWLAAVPVLALAGIAAAELAQTPRADWMALWMGHSARQCPARVALLSLPIFAGLLWAFRRLAPTRLRFAGAAAGLAAGASAATLYGFACPETSALFVVTWYTLGIAFATAIGALLGPRLLRW